MLTKRGIQHKVLNAKFHELEAEIVADAGVHGAVTIATNMAGRGTAVSYTHLDVYKRQVFQHFSRKYHHLPTNIFGRIFHPPWAFCVLKIP